VSSRGLAASWQRIFATERPTVPKPISPIFSFLPALAAFLAGAAFVGFFLLLDGRAFANARLPRLESDSPADTWAHILPKPGKYRQWKGGHRADFFLDPAAGRAYRRAKFGSPRWRVQRRTGSGIIDSIRFSYAGAHMERPAGVTFLAILAFFGAVILALGGLVMCLGFPIMSRMAVYPRMGMMAGIGSAIIGLMLLGVAAVYVVMGIGLWKLQNWARILTIVLACLGALFFGLGMLGALVHFHIFLLFWRAIFLALNVWIIVYLLQPNVKQSFGATAF
jgi:uncharacterized membrane protein (DUF2068 family)